MKKGECERAIRSLVHDWARVNGVKVGQAEQPSFSSFKSWLGSNGYGRYLDCRSTMGPDEDAERWFDRELRQTWRN